MASSTDIPFEKQIHDSFEVLRAALKQLFASVQADELKSFPLARRLDINKNLTWKASKIIRAERPSEAIKHIPGKAGIKLLLDAMAAHGADQSVVDQAREAFGSLDSLIERHSGDRATLEVMLDGLSANESEGESLVASRRLAFRGNQSIWGMQAEARITTFILAPTQGAAPGSNLFDNITITGLIGLQRLRPETPWTLMRSRFHNDDGSSHNLSLDSYALDREAFAETGIPLLSKFSTPGMQPLATRVEGSETVIELPVGPVGKQGKRDVFFGRIDRQVAALAATPTEKLGEFLADYLLPLEHAQLNVMIHEDLPQLEDCVFRLFSRMDGRLPPPSNRRDALALPIPLETHDLGMGLKAAQTDLYEHQAELIETCLTNLGLDSNSYRNHRVTVEYPPMGTTGVFSFPLPERS